LIDYTDSTTTHIDTVRGFLVNVEWVRCYYFEQLAIQIGNSGEGGRGIHFSVASTTTSTDTDQAHTSLSSKRPFSIFFFDPVALDLNPPSDLREETWLARATVENSREIIAVKTGTRMTLLVSAISALAVAFGLALTAQATIAKNRLSDMRSDFTAAVTHDLKTPIATIRAVSESFLIRANVDQSTRRNYGSIVLNETKRLTRLIDNLLTYSRISDVTDIYAFKPISPATLLRRIHEDFRFQLESSDFDVTIDVPADLPCIRGDETALALVFSNLIDNAIRYSDIRRVLTLKARATQNKVIIDVVDAGVGIARNELDHVTKKFYRGSTTTSGGSGLGLAIALQLIVSHGGHLSIASEPNYGTIVSVTLVQYEETA
jgi:two-component system phosphate regulon sensor histidine kinase PhoR